MGVQAPPTPPTRPPATIDDGREAEADRTVATAPAPMVVPAPAFAAPPDFRPLVRVAVEEAVAPLRRALRDLEHRVEELERRPYAAAIAAPVAARASTQAGPAAAGVAPGLAVATPPAAVVVAQPAAAAHPVTAPAPPLLDVHAIEHDVSIDVDLGALDGRRRRRRHVIAFVVLIVLVFGGMFTALAASYMPHH